MGGHSDLIAGSITGKEQSTEEAVINTRSTLGGTIDPHQAWLLTRGLRTLPLRMKQHQESGLKFCKTFINHPKIKDILYPGSENYPQKDLSKKYLSGYSGLLTLIIDGEFEKVHKALKTLEFFEEGCSWGGFESLYIMLNIKDYELDRNYEKCTMVRLSIGLEDINSLISDFENALSKI
jgi:cystathionine gamma-lyase